MNNGYKCTLKLNADAMKRLRIRKSSVEWESQDWNIFIHNIIKPRQPMTVDMFWVVQLQVMHSDIENTNAPENKKNIIEEQIEPITETEPTSCHI